MNYTTQWPTLLSVVISCIVSSTVHANSAPNSASVDEHVTIFGNKNSVNDIPGSAHIINKDDLEKFDYSDIMRTLTSIPGVYVLEEDGYGLRPNIGMRGTGQNRSDKITIMEDGVLAAPAPYAAPSAYYFPTAGRMQQIEVLKGTSSVMYGPRTTGGVINMLSRQIPNEKLAGQLNLQAGQDGFGKLHAFVGSQNDNIGSLFEVYRYQADGYKNINHSNVDSGFVKNDYLAKVRYNTDEDATFYQELELKVKYSDEDSNETYMGLTEQDFQTSPYSRYSASQKDNMSTEHILVQLNHFIQLSDKFSLGTSIYHNDFSRNWYKASKIDGSSLGSGGIEVAAQHDKSATGILTVDVKANNRDYLSQGIQTVLNVDANAHQLKIGLRFHKDEMDRFQWVDKYNIDTNYLMQLTEKGIPGTDSNLVDSAEAIALFVHDEWTMGNLMVNAGLRYESMKIERNDWKKTSPDRTASPIQKSNDLDVVLPSVALTYRLNNDLVLLAGIQKGFAPPSPGNDKAEAEESLNYELGTRYQKDQLNAEAIIFISDYENMHGNCTASQNCNDDNIGNQYNAGEVKISGLEVKAGYTFEFGDASLPIDFSYTHSKTEFLNSFDSSFWGDVKAGDEFPYVPENQLQLTAGLQTDKWSTNLLMRYVSKMRTTPGNTEYNQPIDARTVVDFVANYHLARNQKITLNVDNLFDKTYMSSRTHGSIMVGKPLSATIGYQYTF